MGSLTMDLGGRVPSRVRPYAYRAQQFGMLSGCLLGHRVLRFISRNRIDVEKADELAVQQRYQQLIDRDLDNVDRGLYPRELLFQFPFLDYLKAAPHLAFDVPRTLWRMWRGNYEDFPDDVDVEQYPAYFRRNFHWQTDGYFSKRSARIYDVGVELLFLGTADVMRRQVIPPISRIVQDRGDELRVLDVGCGTGRTLHQLAIAHPRLRYYGLDLSPYYIQHAREQLSGIEHLSLVADNAERMPFRDGYFDAVTSVYLFHELPKKARRNVYADMFRVLKPGGVVVIEDSAQHSESGQLAFFLGRFSSEFHEPFFEGYLRDDIAAALERAGFIVESTEPQFVSKVVVARKPV
jgi:ubiquinone/menaquinone biosynthesis C-methylase UbiE